jgi:Mg2+/Co2+ transporter CorB
MNPIYYFVTRILIHSFFVGIWRLIKCLILPWKSMTSSILTIVGIIYAMLFLPLVWYLYIILGVALGVAAVRTMFLIIIAAEVDRNTWEDKKFDKANPGLKNEPQFILTFCRGLNWSVNCCVNGICRFVRDCLVNESTLRDTYKVGGGDIVKKKEKKPGPDIVKLKY